MFHALERLVAVNPQMHADSLCREWAPPDIDGTICVPTGATFATFATFAKALEEWLECASDCETEAIAFYSGFNGCDTCGATFAAFDEQTTFCRGFTTSTSCSAQVCYHSNCMLLTPITYCGGLGQAAAVCCMICIWDVMALERGTSQAHTNIET